ncbi:MAG: 23S rRNA (adenine(2503)-C(2))-methyltransferase RlmN [Acidobacteriota bacterium]
MQNLVGASLEEITKLMAGWNEPIYRARQIYAGIYGRLAQSWDSFTELGKILREKLKIQCCIEYPQVEETFISKDRTCRYLFKTLEDQRFESVFIPEEKRDTFCISTQIGCAVGCLFCATGKLKMQRNLIPGEIVGQIMALRHDRDTEEKRLNIVIMGMGEPMNNYSNVMRAIRLMTDERGMSISPRRITLSTAGVVPGIRKLAGEPVIPNLAISLNATTDEVRDQLVPINKKWNVGTLLDACREFSLETRRRITFEYVLIGGMNDSIIDAHRLVKLLKGLRKKVNLIPLNPAPSVSLKPPAQVRVLEFHKILIDHHVNANIRRARGGDIAAACGMLAANRGT